jgi:hypothetical protein
LKTDGSQRLWQRSWRCEPTYYYGGTYEYTESDDADVHAAPAEQPPAGGPPPVHVRDKHGEFLKGRLPVFSHAADLLEADDWVRAVEKQLNIAQCNDLEKVLYASDQL